MFDPKDSLFRHEEFEGELDERGGWIRRRETGDRQQPLTMMVSLSFSRENDHTVIKCSSEVDDAQSVIMLLVGIAATPFALTGLAALAWKVAQQGVDLRSEPLLLSFFPLLLALSGLRAFVRAGWDADEQHAVMIDFITRAVERPVPPVAIPPRKVKNIVE